MIYNLTHRLSQSEIHELCALTQGEHNDNLKEELYQLTLDADRRVATNALWVFTHFAAIDNKWLYAKHDQLIDCCLEEEDTTKLRLMLIYFFASLIPKKISVPILLIIVRCDSPTPNRLMPLEHNASSLPTSR